VLRDSQTFRPEIVSRFDQVYVFKPLEGIVNAEIACLKIIKAGQEYGVEIEHIDDELVYRIMERSDAARDTRELTRIVDTTLGELLLQAEKKVASACGSRQVRTVNRSWKIPDRDLQARFRRWRDDRWLDGWRECDDLPDEIRRPRWETVRSAGADKTNSTAKNRISPSWHTVPPGRVRSGGDQTHDGGPGPRRLIGFLHPAQMVRP